MVELQSPQASVVATPDTPGSKSLDQLALAVEPSLLLVAGILVFVLFSLSLLQNLGHFLGSLIALCELVVPASEGRALEAVLPPLSVDDLPVDDSPVRDLFIAQWAVSHALRECSVLVLPPS